MKKTTQTRSEKLAENYKMMRIFISSHAKLKTIAEKEKRAMTDQLEIILDKYLSNAK